MALFRRKRTSGAEPADATPDVATSPEAPEEKSGRSAEESQDLIGPWDITEEPDLGNRVDLGALRVPKRPGLQVRMEVDKKTRRVVAVNLSLDGSALQLQAFAAPRSEGLWDGLREELQTQITKQGGSASIKTGVFGEELLARLPVRLPDGRSGHRPARFIGVDGPRWFLRGVLTGQALSSEQAGIDMEGIFGDVVVVRGEQPRPPRDLLPLHLPGGREETQSGTRRPGLETLQRGPEITETR